MKPAQLPDPHNALTVARARTLRIKGTQTEDSLWQALRNRQVRGVKFRRQHPIGIYTVDFYAAELKLAVEVDGWPHRGFEDADKNRQAVMEKQGVRFVRLQAAEVFRDLAGAVRLIEAAVDDLLRMPEPSS